MININFKKISRYFLLLLIGIFMISYGVISLSLREKVVEKLSDDEIIRRAKDLGLVEIRDVYINDDKN